MDLQLIKANVKRALKEDKAKNDLSLTMLKGISDKTIKANLTVNEKAILSGTKWFEESFKQLENKIKVKWNFKEGENLPKNSLVATIRGPAGPLIVATREFFGRFSPSLKFHLTLILFSSCLKLSSNHFVPDNIAFSLTVKFALIVLSEMPFSIVNDRSFLALSSFNALLTFALIN